MPLATASSTGCTGDRPVTPVSRPSSAAGSDGSSNCTTTGHSSRRATWRGERPRPRPATRARSRTRAGIGDRPVPVGQLQLRGQRDRARRLHLDRPVAPPRRPAFSHASSSASMSSSSRLTARRVDRAAARGDAVPARHGVDADVDKQGAGAADHVGADAPGRQLDQVRQRVQFADDHLGGLTCDVPGQDPMPVAAAKSLTRPTVFDTARYALICGTARTATMPAAVRPTGGDVRRGAAGRGVHAHRRGHRDATAPGIDDDSRSPVDVDVVLLDQAQMRAITGRGRRPHDHSEHGRQVPRRHRATCSNGAPPQCQWYLRRDADVRPRGRGVPQDDVPEPARRRR